MPSALLTCMGTRGDVQPFIALGLGMISAGYEVSLAVPEEYETFVTDFGLPVQVFARSMQRAAQDSEAARKLNANVAANENSTEDFFMPLFTSWFEDILRWTKRLKPDVLVLTQWPWLAGCAVIPEFCQHPVSTILVHLVPATPTKEFAQPVAEIGLSSKLRILNKVTWWLSDRMVLQGLYRDLAVKVIHSYSTKLSVPSPVLAQDFNQSKLTNLYIYSRHLLPKPKDWPTNCHVVGPCLLPMIDYNGPLPFGLQGFIEEAHEQNSKVVFIGFGSMLASHFDAMHVMEILDAIVAGVQAAQKKSQCHVILQTADSISREGAQDVPHDLPDHPGLYYLDYAFPHNVLFNHCDLLIHHGGAGTVHSGLASGKPMVVIPCLSPSDQAFWGDMVKKRGLGPKGFSIQQLTPKKLAKTVMEALKDLDKYTKTAVELARLIKEENGVVTAVGLIADMME